uniref:Uncharacterized protein n=1 Tax=Glossina palpalis gambiensis TaxID=67801 RepID=A0A1B0BLI7_9MUSC
MPYDYNTNEVVKAQVLTIVQVLNRSCGTKSLTSFQTKLILDWMLEYVRDVRIFVCISACSVSQTFRVSNNTSNVTCYFQCFANHKNLFGVLWLKECCLICRSSVTVAILPIPGYVDLTEGNLVC